MNNQKSRWLRPALILVLVIAAVSALVYPFFEDLIHPKMYILSDTEKLTITEPYLLAGEVAEDTFTIPRGAKVTIEERGDEKTKVSYKDAVLTIPNENLSETKLDCVDYEYVYPRRMLNLRNNKEGSLSDQVVQKGEELKVVSALASDLNPENGRIAWFEVEKDGQNFYIPGGLVETTAENAMKDYGTDLKYNAVYDNTFYDGYSQWAYIDQNDFKGLESVSYPDNPIREDLRGIHLTLENLIKNKEELKKFGRESGVNTLVVGLKGLDGKLFYDSEVPAEYFSDTSEVLSNPLISKQGLKDLVAEMKNAGFYMVGRMETFADNAYAQDHPDQAISDKTNGQMLLLADSYWASPYVRDVWEYNGSLAKEFAEMGFNEVEFDFCRFPDGITKLEAEDKVELHNTYNESKASAIQGFLYYIRELLEPLHTYAAADVYSGVVAELYDYDIGQYYPAILAAADVTSPMLYLDQFPFWLYGYQEMDQDARDITRSFIEQNTELSKGVVYPAEARVWLQGYNNTNADRLRREILGLTDAGNFGYLVWTDQGSMDTLDYLKDGLISTQPALDAWNHAKQEETKQH